MHVNRCVCHEVTFARLIELAKQTNSTFEQLQAMTGCCTGCTMCEPYVHKALATGQASLPLMSPQESSAWRPQRSP